jgi:transcriptional regulator with XRE-family HTH domain
MINYIKNNLRMLLEAKNPYQDELDYLLDKVSSVGYDNLSGVEKQQLKNVSQGQRPDQPSQEDLDIISNFGYDEGYKFGFTEFYEDLYQNLREEYGESTYLLFPDFHEETIQVRRVIGEDNAEMFGMINWVDENRVCYEHIQFKYKYCNEAHFFAVDWMNDFKKHL